MEISRSLKVWEIHFQIAFRVPSIKASIEIGFSSVFDKHTTNNNKKNSFRMKFFKISAITAALVSATMASPLASIEGDVEPVTTSDSANQTEGTVNFDEKTTSEETQESEALERKIQLAPGYAPPEPRPGCNFYPETSKVVVWDEVEREVCEDSVEYGCGSCITDLYKIGNAGLPVKGYQSCKINHKEEPLKLSRGTTVTSTETVCGYVDETHCEYRWVLEDNGDKTWKEDPDTCHTLQVTKCEKVPKVDVSEDYIDLIVKKPEEICCEVVRDDCHRIHERTPRQQEVTIWKEVCPAPDAAPSQPRE